MTLASLTEALGPATRARLVRAGAVAGPAFAVSVGFVDPGNWATDLAAGRYQFTLLWAVVLASLMAIVVQALVVRMTFATGESLATTMVRRWPKGRWGFFIAFAGAAVATDLAEFTGVVVGLRLLLGLALPVAVAVGFVVIMLMLALGTGGMRRMELVLIGMVSLIAIAYVYELHLLHIDVATVLRSAGVPSIPGPGALALVVGIIGATVMPHNIFLHSSFIADRAEQPYWKDRVIASRWFTGETFVALGLAMLVNASILIVGAAIGGSDSIEHAFRTIAPLAGAFAAIVFGAALLCAGLAASTTATIAGDVIAKDFSPFRIPRALRRLLTLAPAAALMLAGVDATSLIVWSQIALALVLPAVILPLIVLSSKRAVMAELPLPRLLLAVGAVTAVLCVGFDVALIAQPLFHL